MSMPSRHVLSPGFAFSLSRQLSTCWRLLAHCSANLSTSPLPASVHSELCLLFQNSFMRAFGPLRSQERVFNVGATFSSFSSFRQLYSSVPCLFSTAGHVSVPSNSCISCVALLQHIGSHLSPMANPAYATMAANTLVIMMFWGKEG